MFGFYVILTLTALLVAFICGVIGYSIGKYWKKKQRMEKQITISIEEYNKLIDMHTKREELPERIEVRKISSKWWRWLKRASCSLLHYNKNVEQQKLIKRCINETSSVLLDNLYGYWRGDLSDYLKERVHLEYFMRRYKDDAYNSVMKWLDKKQRMRVQTTFNDKLKKHCSHHAFIPNWMHDCVEWDDCNIIIENVEQKINIV